MLRKKSLAFTLVEILAVIFIIGIISIISIPTVDKVIKQSKEEMYETQINNIIIGAKNWASKNVALLPDNEGETVSLTLGQLKEEGFVETKIKNPKDKKLFSNDLKIIITKVAKNYDYQIIFENID